MRFALCQIAQTIRAVDMRGWVFARFAQRSGKASRDRNAVVPCNR